MEQRRGEEVKRCRGRDVKEMENEKEMENLRQKNDTGNSMFAQRLCRGDEKHMTATRA